MKPAEVIELGIKETVKDITSDMGSWFAAEFKRRVKANIRTNKFGFTLAKSTIERRLAKGVGRSTPLFETGEYIAAIVRRGTMVGVKPGTHYGNRKQNNYLSYEELSHILENGRKDMGVPAFPVWRKTLEEMINELPELTDKYLQSKSK